jgi:hypothetical protein
MPNELSDPVQQLFFDKAWKKRYFKGLWTISFELKSRVFCHISQLDLVSMGE